jgi:ATP-binding cassette, subfamily B (MDR/TAP), member 1
MAVSQPLGYTVQCISTAVASLCVAFYFCWNLTLVILASVPFVALTVSYLSTRIQPNMDKQNEKLTEATKHATTAFSNIETVKCYNGQDSELWCYSSIIRQAGRFYARQANWNALQQGVVHLSTLGMFIQGFWYGSSLIGAGKSPGQIMTTFWAALMATNGFMQLLPQMIVLQKGRAAAAALRAIIADPGYLEEPRLAMLKPQKCIGDIELKRV